MAAIDASLYDEITIESIDGNKTVDIRLGVVGVDYYEDLFSPTITMKILVTATGGFPGGLYSGLPLRGGERVSLKIEGNSGSNEGLDFSNKEDYLYVSSITNVITDSQKEVFTLNLVSKEALTNETTRVYEKYSPESRIDVSVKKIVEEKLKTNKPVDIDVSSNKYGFLGNLKKPFTVLVWLASKAVSEDGKSAGFFFYQTQDGYKFKSIDNLITQAPFPQTYVYSEVNQHSSKVNNDFKILSYNIQKNQNLIEKLRLGAYSSYLAAYNPLTGEFPSGTVGPQNTDMKNLGQEQEFPEIRTEGNRRLVDIPSRIMTQVVDIGTLSSVSSTDMNADPFNNLRQSVIRYNLLFSQTLDMTVPLNTNLKAGDIISCEFPKITTDKKKEIDSDKSGLYMIKELCHHFDTEMSVTSMKLIRDTFGVYGTNNKK
jgi:hypothetical protein